MTTRIWIEAADGERAVAELIAQIVEDDGSVTITEMIELVPGKRITAMSMIACRLSFAPNQNRGKSISMKCIH